MSQDDRPATRASQVSFSSAGRPLSNQSNAPPLHDFGHFQDITAQARGETRAGPSNEQPATETVLGKHRREPSGWSTGASTVASTRAIPPSSKKQRTWPSGASEIFPADLTTLSPDQLIDNYLIATKNNLEKAADSFEAYRDFVLIADDTSHTKSEPLAKLLRDTEVRFKTFASSQQLAGAKMNSRFADQALEKLAPFDRNARTFYGDLYNFMWANGGYQAGMTKDSLATQYFEVTLEDYDVVDASLDEVSIDITRLEEECKNIDMALRKILRDDPIPEAKLNPNNEENPWEPEDPTHGAGGLDSPPDSPPGGPAGAAAGLSPASSQ